MKNYFLYVVCAVCLFACKKETANTQNANLQVIDLIGTWDLVEYASYGNDLTVNYNSEETLTSYRSNIDTSILKNGQFYTKFIDSFYFSETNNEFEEAVTQYDNYSISYTFNENDEYEYNVSYILASREVLQRQQGTTTVDTLTRIDNDYSFVAKYGYSLSNENSQILHLRNSTYSAYIEDGFLILERFTSFKDVRENENSISSINTNSNFWFKLQKRNS